MKMFAALHVVFGMALAAVPARGKSIPHCSRDEMHAECPGWLRVRDAFPTG